MSSRKIWESPAHHDLHHGKNHHIVDQRLVPDRNIQEEVNIVRLKENLPNIIVRIAHQTIHRADTNNHHRSTKAKGIEDMIPVRHRITDAYHRIIEDRAQVRHLNRRQMGVHQAHHQPADCIKINLHRHMLIRFGQCERQRHQK